MTIDMREWGMSDDAVMAELRSAWKQQGGLTAHIVALLAVAETRRLFLKHAQPSLFDLCTRELGMSEGEACRRIAAARLALKFPQVLEMIQTQRIHLTALLTLKGVLEKYEAHQKHEVDAILSAAAGKSKREVEELVARLAPKPDVEDSIRKQPAPRPSSTTPARPPITSAARGTVDLFATAPCPSENTTATATATATSTAAAATAAIRCPRSGW